MDDQEVKLNVGGHSFVTTLKNIRKEPNSMLATMFHENWCPDPKRDDYFIDRDGEQFAHVLKFIEDPKNFVAPTTLHELRMLINEATFYQLPELTSVLKTAYSKNILGPLVGRVVKFKESIIERNCKDLYRAVRMESPYVFVFSLDKSKRKALAYCPCCNGKEEIRGDTSEIDPQALREFETYLTNSRFEIAGFVNGRRKNLLFRDSKFRQMHIPRCFVNVLRTGTDTETETEKAFKREYGNEIATAFGTI